MIQEGRFHNTTLDEVAKKLDVTKAALCYDVEDKEDLLCRIFRETLEQALVAVEAIVQSIQSPADKLRALIDNQVQMIIGRPAFFSVYFNEKGHLNAGHAEQVTKLERQIIHRATTVLCNGIKTGAFKKVDPTVAAFAVLGASNWVYRWYRAEGRLSGKEVSTILQEVILNGLVKGKG